MKKINIMSIIAIFAIVLSFSSCTENYGNGKKFGIITKFSEEGMIWKAWEGHLNVTQTGMNSANGIDFSIDNDNVPDGLVAKLDSAAMHGWIVELVYHQVSGKNWWNNRGKTNIFVTDCKVMQRNNTFNSPGFSSVEVANPHNIDTAGVYHLKETIIDRGPGYSDTVFVIFVGPKGERLDITSLLKGKE